MADSGIQDGSSVEYVVMANEDSIVKQLKDLLKSRDLTADELGLLYCYKHGVSINQALKTIGLETVKLSDLLKDKILKAERPKLRLVTLCVSPMKTNKANNSNLLVHSRCATYLKTAYVLWHRGFQKKQGMLVMMKSCAQLHRH